MNLKKISKNKKGGLMDLPMNIIVFLMVVAVLVAVVPAIVELIGISQQSDSLNCVGYVYNADPSNPLSYNSSIPTNTMACMAMKLYIPVLVLGVLLGALALILYGRSNPEQPAYG